MPLLHPGHMHGAQQVLAQGTLSRQTVPLSIIPCGTSGCMPSCHPGHTRVPPRGRPRKNCAGAISWATTYDHHSQNTSIISYSLSSATMLCMAVTRTHTDTCTCMHAHAQYTRTRPCTNTHTRAHTHTYTPSATGTHLCRGHLLDHDLAHRRQLCCHCLLLGQEPAQAFAPLHLRSSKRTHIRGAHIEAQVQQRTPCFLQIMGALRDGGAAPQLKPWSMQSCWQPKKVEAPTAALGYAECC